MEVTVEEKDIISYKKRRKMTITTIAIFCIVMLLLAARNNFAIAMLLVGLVFMLSYYRSIKSDTYLLTNLKIHNDQISIRYFKKDEQFELHGHIHEFTIRKQHEILSKTPTPFLSIYHNNILIVKQYTTTVWSSDKMEDVAEYFKKINSPTH